MKIRREVVATANRPEDLLEQQQRKAEELGLIAPQQDQRNDWGPVFTSAAYDLRIDKKTGLEQYELHLLHRLHAGGLLDR